MRRQIISKYWNPRHIEDGDGPRTHEEGADLIEVANRLRSFARLTARDRKADYRAMGSVRKERWSSSATTRTITRERIISRAPWNAYAPTKKIESATSVGTLRLLKPDNKFAACRAGQRASANSRYPREQSHAPERAPALAQAAVSSGMSLFYHQTMWKSDGSSEFAPVTGVAGLKSP